MSGAPLGERLGPPELVDAILTGTLSAFIAEHGETPLLLVRMAEEDAELALGLRTMQDGEGIAEPMQFHTVVLDRDEMRASLRPRLPEDPAAVGQLLQRGAYFAVPLLRREAIDGMSADRVSVGRARNKDIVLRHASVSKFHAWFELDAAGGYRITDAGSRNRTRVNGDPLPPRESRAIGPGDRLQFGSVECVVCSAEALWRAARALRGGA